MTVRSDVVRDARRQLVEAGGRAAQDLGFGRILGQIVAYLYLTDGERSLDQIEEELGLSKAAASVATRHLEVLGFLKRGWRQGDRKVYYRTADNLGDVFRDGLVALISRKVESVALELEKTTVLLDEQGDGTAPEVKFLKSRVRRAKDLSDRANKVLNSRLLGFLSR